MNKFAFGAYGTGNLGDDAILEGMRRVYGKDLIAVCSHPEAISLPSIDMENFLTLVSAGDFVIFGGGGLFYSSAAVKEMETLAKTCLERGAIVECHGVGIEGTVWEEDKDSIRNFAQCMRAITVRSKKSLELLASIGVSAKYTADFGFNLVSPKMREHRGRHIGLVITAPFSNQPEMERLAKIVQELTQIGIVHLIPHVRHFTGFGANDCLAAEYLFVQAHRPTQVIIEPWAGTPTKLLEQYNQMDFILTMRFHGMVLGMVCNRMSKEKIGLACLTADLKYTAFANENNIPTYDFKDITLEWLPDLVKTIKQWFDNR